MINIQLLVLSLMLFNFVISSSFFILIFLRSPKLFLMRPYFFLFSRFSHSNLPISMLCFDLLFYLFLLHYSLLFTKQGIFFLFRHFQSNFFHLFSSFVCLSILFCKALIINCLQIFIYFFFYVNSFFLVDFPPPKF